jgi:DNA-binding transcriptional LysR family regulator
MLAQAVAAGAGAALLPTFMIEAELAAGTLIVPLDLPLIEDRSYYLVYPIENLERSAVRQVRDFICEEAQAYFSPTRTPI